MSMFKQFALVSMMAQMMGGKHSAVYQTQKQMPTNEYVGHKGPTGRFLNQRQRRKLDRQVPQRRRKAA